MNQTEKNGLTTVQKKKKFEAVHERKNSCLLKNKFVPTEAVLNSCLLKNKFVNEKKNCNEQKHSFHSNEQNRKFVLRMLFNFSFKNQKNNYEGNKPAVQTNT